MKNNFNFLRLLFALFVVITHSYPLSGVPENDFMAQLTRGQVSLSFIGLSGFFAISGYWVYKSLEASSSLYQFYWKRILRIFPALFVVLFFTTILAVFVYDGGLIDYVSNRAVWTYLPLNMTLFFQQPVIAGVFSNNPHNPTINGSLWSLPYEFAFYIFISGVFYLHKHRRTLVLIVVVVFLITSSLLFKESFSALAFILEGRLVIEFAPFFFLGSLLAMLPERIRKHENLYVGSLAVLLVVATYLGAFEYVKYFTLPPVVIGIGHRAIGMLTSFVEKVGDLSYGIYIYSFPIQQALVYFFGLSTLPLMFSSIILSAAAGYFSWHCVEKRFLRYKKIMIPQSSMS